MEKLNNLLARLAAILVLVVACASCAPADPEPTVAPAPPPPPGDTALRADLDAYALALEQATSQNVLRQKPAFKSLDEPLSYVLEFATAHPALMTKDDGDTNPDSFVDNTMITAVWETRFCTDELKALMARHGVFLVSGKLFDEKGELQTFTACMQGD